jgi:hypothetical protein
MLGSAHGQILDAQLQLGLPGVCKELALRAVGDRLVLEINHLVPGPLDDGGFWERGIKDTQTQDSDLQRPE